jgi:hypothetical protein
MLTLRFPGTFQNGLVFQWDTTDVRASVLRYTVSFQF